MWSYSRYVRRRITSVLALSAIGGPSVKTGTPAEPGEPASPGAASAIPPAPTAVPVGGGEVPAAPPAAAPVPALLQPATASTQKLPRTKLEVRHTLLAFILSPVRFVW